jgi:branched-chain amino acid transport system permease protein
LEQLLQYLLNGIITGGILALPTIGFSLLYKILRFPNFAFGTYLTCGAYAALLVNVTLGQSIFLGLFAAMVITAGVSISVDQLVFRKLRQRRSLVLAIASIGAVFVLENIIRFIWGGDIQYLKIPVARDIKILGAHIGREQTAIFLAACFFMLAIQLLLKKTRLGKALRALADNPILAEIKGIDRERMVILIAGIGGALAGASGVFLGVDTVIDPLMGFNVILSIFAGAILGGIGNAGGAMAGAMVIGLAEEMSLILIPPTYKTAVGLGVIILILIANPAGFTKG